MHLDLACRPEEILTLTWLNVHPLRNDLGAPMWLDINKFRKGVVAPIDHYIPQNSWRG